MSGSPTSSAPNAAAPVSGFDEVRPPSGEVRPPPAGGGAPRAAGGGGVAAACRLLFASAAWTERTPPAAAVRAVPWVTPLGFLIGLAWIAVFRAAWRLYGDPDMTRVRVLPAVAVLLLEAWLTGRQLASGCAQGWRLPRSTNSGPSAAEFDVSPLLAVMLYLLATWALILSIPERIGWYASGDDWRRFFNHFYPIATYRPLLLAPLWGRWAILLAAGVGRPGAHADHATRAFCAAVRPGRVLAWMIAPVILTALFANREGMLAAGLMTSLIALLFAYLAAFALARRHGGQSRATLLATGAAAQVAFLAAYRALCV